MKRSENAPEHTDGSTPTTGTSRSLLDRIRADEPSAWEQLVALYAPLVYHWCRRFSLQEADLADIVQEVFKAVAGHIAAFRKEKPADTFRGWLRTITRNKAHDFLRQRAQEPAGAGGTDAQQRLAQVAEAEPRDESTPERQVQGGFYHRVLELIRQEFEERTWQAFWKTAIEERAARDVAAELSMTSGAVRVAKCRVLQRLRQELRDLGEDGGAELERAHQY